MTWLQSTFLLNLQVFVNFAKDQSDDHSDSSIRRKDTAVNMALLSPLSTKENIEKPIESFVWASLSLFTLHANWSQWIPLVSQCFCGLWAAVCCSDLCLKITGLHRSAERQILQCKSMQKKLKRLLVFLAWLNLNRVRHSLKLEAIISGVDCMDYILRSRWQIDFHCVR